jgi:hypothetical protein
VIDQRLASARLLATDLDGTLLRPDGTVGQVTRDALSAASRRGVRTVFVTGRPPRWMPPVADATGHRALTVCANGAVVLDLADESIVATSPIPQDAVEDAIEAIRSMLPGRLFFAVEQAVPGPMAASGLHPEPGFVPPTRPWIEPAQGPLHRVAGVVKLLARTDGDPAQTSAIAAEVASALHGRVTITHASRIHQMLEISAAGVDKASALARVADRWGIPAQSVAAVGDMPNDIPMLRWAGVGLAVSSAHRDLLDFAEAVVGDPQDDGVATILDRMGRPAAL